MEVQGAASTFWAVTTWEAVTGAKNTFPQTCSSRSAVKLGGLVLLNASWMTLWQWEDRKELVARTEQMDP